MELLQELVGSGEERLKTQASQRRKDECEKDFELFCKTYLPHYFGSEGAPYHPVIMEIVSNGTLTARQIATLKPMIKKKYHGYMQSSSELAGIVDVEPRGFSKSTRFSLAFPLWITLYKKRNFPILFAASQTLAESNLESISDEIEQNELIFEDFGDVKGSIWTKKKITLKNGTAIMAFGAGSAVRGARNGPHRPDVAICDDIMTDVSADSKLQRDKLYRWFKRVVLPLGRDILPVLINTIFHEDDIVCRLLKEIEEGQLKGWVGFRFAARTPSGQSLWPAYWTEEKLQKKQDELGSAAWSTEMMNEPLSSEDSIIKSFTYYSRSELNLSGCKMYGGIDPATGAHDKCAFATVASNGDGVLYVVDSWGERLAEPAFLEKIIATFSIFSHIAIGFEAIAFQGIYKDNLMEKAAQRNVWLPINGRKTGGLSKVERVRKMAPLIEAGFIRFRKDQKELVEQLSMFTPDGPKSAYDDEADALWYAFEEAQGSGRAALPFGVPLDRHGLKRGVKHLLRGFSR